MAHNEPQVAEDIEPGWPIFWPLWAANVTGLPTFEQLLSIYDLNWVILHCCLEIFQNINSSKWAINYNVQCTQIQVWILITFLYSSGISLSVCLSVCLFGTVSKWLYTYHQTFFHQLVGFNGVAKFWRWPLTVADNYMWFWEETAFCDKCLRLCRKQYKTGYIWGGSPYVCSYRLTESDEIWHGNTWRGVCSQGSATFPTQWAGPQHFHNFRDLWSMLSDLQKPSFLWWLNYTVARKKVKPRQCVIEMPNLNVSW